MSNESERPSAPHSAVVGSDHRGIAVKRIVVETLRDLGADVEDVGAYSEEAVDYPDFAALVGSAVGTGRADRGVLVCGTGIGMSIAANKVAGVRAALVRDVSDARLARQHNDANVLVVGGGDVDGERIADIVRVWWNTGFEGGRHARRVAKIVELESGGRGGGSK